MSDLMMNVHTCFFLKYPLHHFLCQISMSDLMMNVHTCVTGNTTYTML